MEYIVKPTSTKQRRYASGDYIIVMNKKVKSSENIGKYAVVKYLFINRKNTLAEYRTMTTFGKVVVDDSLGDGELALDQSIRNAIGIPFGVLDNVKVRVAPLKCTFGQMIFDKVHHGNYHFARVHKPDVVDIEKNFCRMKGDSIHVMGALEGKTIILEKTTSALKMNTNQILNRMTSRSFEEGLSALSEYREQLININLNRELEYCLINLLSNVEYDNSYSAVEDVLRLDNCEDNIRKVFLNNVFEFWDWELATTYTKISLKLPVYTLQEESVSRIESIKNSQTKISFFTRYPDSEKIFEVNPDISGIYLDKYYRDLLNCDLLDSVKVKKNLIAIILNEIMEYGIMFIMSVLATVMAFNGENHQQSVIALLISLVITGSLIRVRTK